jgi:hypothetical protein
MCYIEPTGVPDHCRMTSNTGSPALAAQTLAWLQGPNPPRYRPARRNGKDVGAWHSWVIVLQPTLYDIKIKLPRAAAPP